LDARAIVVLQIFGDLRFFFAGRGLVDGDEDRRGVIREHLAVEGGPLGLNVLQKLGRQESKKWQRGKRAKEEPRKRWEEESTEG
jgi:hypothetical protein